VVRKGIGEQEDIAMMRAHARIELLMFLLAAGILTIVPPAIVDEEPENLAFEMIVTGSGGIGQGTYELLTDGDTASDPYLGGPTWVQIDLQDIFWIDTIKLWHYYADGRTYHDNKVALSEKGNFLGEEVVVFDTNTDDAEYPETAEGKTIKFDAVEARYIRAWVGGSTANEWSHWVELQAFFVGQVPVRPMQKLPITWGRIKAP
jgi:hypothetical protein